MLFQQTAGEAELAAVELKVAGLGNHTADLADRPVESLSIQTVMI